MPATRESSVVNGGADLETSVVSLLVQWGHENVPVDPRPPAGPVCFPVGLSQRVSHGGDMSHLSPDNVGDE